MDLAETAELVNEYIKNIPAGKVSRLFPFASIMELNDMKSALEADPKKRTSEIGCVVLMMLSRIVQEEINESNRKNN